jgi:uncharacterized ion transporter superfamily protein YfcC
LNLANKQVYRGALVLVLGIAAALQSRTYTLGSLASMGPGFFPLMLGCALAIVGGAILAQGVLRSGQTAAVMPSELRGKLCIAFAIAAFVLVGTQFGLLPATCAVVFIAALGDRRNKLSTAVTLAFAMCVVAALVFWWALQIQFPLLQWGEG